MLAWVLYFGYCAFVELTVLRRSCIHSYYYGKVCGLGKGKLCSLLFKRGNPQMFLQREVSFRDIVPDLLVSAISLVGGTAPLLRQFNWAVLLAMLSILLLASAGTGFVRGSLACRYCARREMGCPAEKLFSKQRAQVQPNNSFEAPGAASYEEARARIGKTTGMVLETDWLQVCPGH